MMTECSPTANWQDTEWNTFHTWIEGVLKTTTATVTFTKKDGSERVMKCTLNPQLLPTIPVVEGKRERKIPEHSIAVYDTDIKEWRSFVVKSVKNIKFVPGE